ncbi:YdcF family protein [Marilutibacter maris]|uniref:Uncharacterized protein n=1 Tax=Marilutibacter maris TaxID=1605891 RepID=A0A508A7G5_9GAMM|nr:YdcF family protein [Lysobacter maris]KAB8173367.1 hypothetical protein FKV24_014080 [Lysobacter maris]
MWILSPLSWLLLALVGVCLCARSRGRRARALSWACAMAAVLAVLAMTPMVANLLVAMLEKPVPVSGAGCGDGEVDVAVVLAGAIDDTPVDAGDFRVLSLSSRRRVEAGVAWWSAGPGRVLVMSGGPQPGLGATPDGDTVATASLMAAYAQRLGVDTAALRMEAGSSTTWENAQGLRRQRPALPPRVVLVTSAMHMPRARFALTRAGFQVCPLATDRRQLPFGLPGSLVPGSSALEKTEAAVHELVGLAHYRVRAWRGSDGE